MVLAFGDVGLNLSFLGAGNWEDKAGIICFWNKDVTLRYYLCFGVGVTVAIDLLLR